MSSSAGSDSGGSSQETSAYDYESAAYGVTSSTPSYDSGGSSYDYESAAYGIGSPSVSIGATDTGDLGTVAENMAVTQAAQSYEAPSQSIGDIARSAVDLYTQYSPLGMISRGVSSLFDSMTPKQAYDYEFAAYAPSMIPGYASDGGLQPELFANQAEYNYAVSQAEKAARSLAGEDPTFLTGTGGDSDIVAKYAPVAPYVISGQTPIESQVNKYFANLNQGQSSLSSQLENDYNAAKASVAQTLSISPLSNQFGYATQPYGSYSSSNLSLNPFNIPYLQSRGLI